MSRTTTQMWEVLKWVRDMCQLKYNRGVCNLPKREQGLCEVPTAPFLAVIRKEVTKVTPHLRRPPPDPWLGSPVELQSYRVGGLRDLIRIGKTLPSKGVAAEEAPPALL
jgi:hypothetical protein